MARSTTAMLDNGDAFPKLTLKLVDGSELTLPQESDGKWTVFLVYRGHW